MNFLLAAVCRKFVTGSYLRLEWIYISLVEISKAFDMSPVLQLREASTQMEFGLKSLLAAGWMFLLFLSVRVSVPLFI